MKTLFLVTGILLSGLTFGQISITTTSFIFTQDFNTLANTGSGNVWNDNTTISGWYSSSTTYNASNGSSTTGSLYSFGSTGSSERALGSIASGTTGSVFYGVRLINNSGSTITQIPIRYDGEQWRDAGNTTQSLSFTYQIGAAGLTSGTWTSVSALDFIGPIASSTPGPLDGNNAANRTIISGTISLSLNNGEEVWFRWEDVDNSGSDHGLAIDNFIFNPNGDPLPVEFSSFSAVVLGNTVKLNWRTETEVNNYGFEIHRSIQNENWEVLGFVEGYGNSNSPKDYSFVDGNISAGKFSYRLKQLDTDGRFEYSKIIEVVFSIPQKFELNQNYPNPFNPTTKIQFTISDVQFTTLKIYDVLGNEIATLIDEERPAGSYEVEFNAAGLPSGIYFYKLQAVPGTGESFVSTKKMLLLK